MISRCDDCQNPVSGRATSGDLKVCINDGQYPRVLCFSCAKSPFNFGTIFVSPARAFVEWVRTGSKEALAEWHRVTGRR